MIADRLHFTGVEEADRLLVEDPFALLIGFALDQRVPVPKAFMGPWVLRERLGSLSPAVVAGADLEPIFRQIPAIHRFPAMMAKQVNALAVHVVSVYDGDAAAVWTRASTSDELRENIDGLPGYGKMKVKALGSVLFKRFDVALAEPLVPWHPTLGDVDSAEALANYQASKKANKALWEA
ncbi:DNA repair protein [Solirubrobacter taibaiensis]|nr:DNA repair protein [Solirubrobacter taibaiensis]